MTKSREATQLRDYCERPERGTNGINMDRVGRGGLDCRKQLRVPRTISKQFWTWNGKPQKGRGELDLGRRSGVVPLLMTMTTDLVFSQLQDAFGGELNVARGKMGRQVALKSSRDNESCSGGRGKEPFHLIFSRVIQGKIIYTL